MTEQLGARHQEHIQSTGQDLSETLGSYHSLGVLASSAEEQAASLEAMLNFEYIAQAEIVPAAKPPALVADKSAPHQRWRKLGSLLRK